MDCSIQSRYTEDCVTWDFLARRELEKPSAGEELTTAMGRASDIARREERCSLIYEEGLKSLPTGMSHTSVKYDPQKHSCRQHK